MLKRISVCKQQNGSTLTSVGNVLQIKLVADGLLLFEQIVQ
jgi:hypothetical protein